MAEDATSRVQELIAREPLPQDDAGGLLTGLQRVCAAAARALPVSIACVTLMTDGGDDGVTAASGPPGAFLEELQFTTGDGPRIEAYSLRRPVLVPDLSSFGLTRWPGFARAAQGQGVCAVFAFPLQVGAARLGVLTLHRSLTGSVPPEHLRLALAFAEVAVTQLLDGQAAAPEGAAATGIEKGLDHRAELYQAQGMVMIQLEVGLKEAMARLRAYAYAHDERLGEVARQVVSGRLRLPLDGSQR